VLAYLSRYTHRVAVSNSRLIALDDKGVTFKWKDYRGRMIIIETFERGSTPRYRPMAPAIRIDTS